MESESKLILELWTYLNEVVPNSKKEEAAIHLLQLFEDNGFEVIAGELYGEDTTLDNALEALDKVEELDEEEEY
jgi:hypothetical protein